MAYHDQEREDVVQRLLRVDAGWAPVNALRPARSPGHIEEVQHGPVIWSVSC